jgi:hypothetical protein
MGNHLSFVLGRDKMLGDAEANTSQDNNAELKSSQNQNAEGQRSHSQNTEAISSRDAEPWPKAIECNLQQPNSTDPRLQDL